MRRGCLFGVGGVLVLCLVTCGLLYFVGLPRIQDRVADDFEDGVSTVVAEGIANAAPGSGTMVITEEQLNDKLSDDVENSDVVSEITPAGISIELNLEESGDRNIGYSALPIAQDGQLVLTEVEANDGVMERFLPKVKLADAVEDGVNGVLAEHNLQVVDVTLGDGEMTLTTAPASE
jgi:hypothetical protein